MGIGTKNESEKIPGIQISRAWHLDFKAKNTRYFSVPISRYLILSCPTLSDLFNVNLNAFCMFNYYTTIRIWSLDLDNEVQIIFRRRVRLKLRYAVTIR